MDGSIVARYNMNGHLIPGKLVISQNSCFFGYLNSVTIVTSCEYLVAPSGYSGRLEWISGRPGEVPCGGLVGGHSANGTDLLYLARVDTQYGLRNGAYSEKDMCVYHMLSSRHTTPKCWSSFDFLIYKEGKKSY